MRLDEMPLNFPTMAERELQREPDTFSYEQFQEFEPQECAVCSDEFPELYEDEDGFFVCADCLLKQANEKLLEPSLTYKYLYGGII